MAALALAGITGIYLRQVRQMRVLGLVGFVAFAASYLLLLSTDLMAVFLLPALTDKAPNLVNDVIVAVVGGTATASTVATIALAVLPASFERPMAVPEGVALIALGISLWPDQRQTAPTAASATALVEHSAVRSPPAGSSPSSCSMGTAYPGTWRERLVPPGPRQTISSDSRLCPAYHQVSACRPKVAPLERVVAV